MSDIRNTYLQDPSSEKYCAACGDDLGIENIGKRVLIRRDFYGGKAAGREFRNHLRSCVQYLSFIPYLAYLETWMRPGEKSDGSEHYECVLLHVGNALVARENAEITLRKDIKKYFNL